MALQKQALNLNFQKGLDLKSDPYQIPLGNFLELENSIFTKAGLLQKRNGFQSLTALSNPLSSFLTTFNGNLTAIGSTLQAYIGSNKTWVNKGSIQPSNLSTLSLIRSNANQTQCDSAVSSSGVVCTVYTETTSSTVYRYAIADLETGQNIIAPTTIAAAAGSPKVWVLGNYFVIVFKSTTANHLQYIAVSIANPSIAAAAIDISTVYLSAGTDGAWEGVVANNNLYISYNASDGGGAIRTTYLDFTLAQHNTVIIASKSATSMSVSADVTGVSKIIWVVWYTTSGTSGFAAAYDQNLNVVLASTAIITSGTIKNITSAAQNGVMQVFYEVSNAYSYDSGVPTNFINTRTVTNAGVVGSITTLKRSVGLASKAFIENGIIYLLTTYSSSNQPTYFLMDSLGNIIVKIAYSNGGGYLTLGLPNVSIENSILYFPYLFKDQVEAVNKTQGLSVNGIYAQTGINLAKVTIGAEIFSTAEIANDLNFSGGFLWSYDGYSPVEQGFFVWPDNVEATTATTGGHLADQQYFYQALYEWTDNQGNINRSAPSIPITITTAGGGTSTNTVNVPTLRLTYKTANPVKIVLYRWSTAQQTYYQVTSVSTPTLNSLTSDSVAILDTLADSSIVGNSILYTTGGVIEDISAPATNILALFKSRLFLVDAEDPNLLWFSKQVIESTPVEMSDLLTIYVAPTTSAQGNTGPITALSAMDDKLIIFKKDAIYYLTGTGPDNTGANNDFSDPIFITSTVGSVNQNSIVFIPQGLMFQSDKGIWLLGRDLSTNYIGAPVEDFNSSIVLSALSIPGTNQVRFTLDSGVTLMYDYFYGQWGTFFNIPAISSTLYQGLHTFLNAFGQVLQEKPGSYLDGSKPVVMSFKTGWLNLAGLQGYERIYDFYLLGTYLSPHQLAVQVAYNYAPAASQQSLITPTNFNANFGGDSTWGASSPLGGNASLEQWRVHTQRQQCESVQISVQEIYDASFGVVAGPGLTMSGINATIGIKRRSRPLGAQKAVG